MPKYKTAPPTLVETLAYGRVPLPEHMSLRCFWQPSALPGKAYAGVELIYQTGEKRQLVLKRWGEPGSASDDVLKGIWFRAMIAASSYMDTAGSDTLIRLAAWEEQMTR